MFLCRKSLVLWASEIWLSYSFWDWDFCASVRWPQLIPNTSSPTWPWRNEKKQERRQGLWTECHQESPICYLLSNIRFSDINFNLPRTCPWFFNPWNPFHQCKELPFIKMNALCFLISQILLKLIYKRSALALTWLKNRIAEGLQYSHVGQ